jgi:small subunit ribosomal protein S8
MVLTDPIGDMLNRIQNGYRVKKQTVQIPASKFKLAIAEVLVRAGYVGGAKVVQAAGHDVIEASLAYNPEPAMQTVSRISRPGQRIYASTDQIPRFLQGYGTVIISTPQGVMTGEEAKKSGVGGELICKVS